MLPQGLAFISRDPVDSAALLLRGLVYKTRARGAFVVISMEFEPRAPVCYPSDLGKRRQDEGDREQTTQSTQETQRKHKRSAKEMLHLRRALCAYAAELRVKQLTNLMASLDMWKLGEASDQVQELLLESEPQHHYC